MQLTKLNRKQELNAEIEMANACLADIDTKIEIYSTIDMIRVVDLCQTKRELELVFLDLLNESNELWLQDSVKAC